MDERGNQKVRDIWSTILDVSPTSDATTIKKAYYKKSKSGPYRHTDKGGDKNMFQALNNAHDGLQSADMHLREAASQRMANNRARPSEDEEQQRPHEQDHHQQERAEQIRRQQEQRARDQVRRAEEELRRRQQEERQQPQQQQQQQQQDCPRPEEQQEADDTDAADKEATSGGKKAYTSCVKNAKKIVFHRINELLVFLCFLNLFIRIFFAKIGHKGVQKYHACRTLVEEVYCDRSNKNMWTMTFYSCVRTWNGHTGDHDTCGCPMCCWERQARFDCGCRAGKQFINLTPCQCHCCQNNKGFRSFVKGYAGLDETYNREEL